MTAPNEPEVKAQGFEEWWLDHSKEWPEQLRNQERSTAFCAWQAALSGANAACEVTQVCECEYTREIDANGEQVVVMCNYHKEMGEYYTKGFIAGQSSQVRLPEKLIEATLDTWPVKEPHYQQGYNAAIDDMRKLNGLENV